VGEREDLGVHEDSERIAADSPQPYHCGLTDIGEQIVLKLRTSVLC